MDGDWREVFNAAAKSDKKDFSAKINLSVRDARPPGRRETMRGTPLPWNTTTISAANINRDHQHIVRIFLATLGTTPRAWVEESTPCRTLQLSVHLQDRALPRNYVLSQGEAETAEVDLSGLRSKGPWIDEG
jgi:hypothetical protein